MATSCGSLTAPTPGPDTGFVERLFDDLDYAAMSYLCEAHTMSVYATYAWRVAAIAGIAIIGFNFIFGGQSTVRDLIITVAKIAIVLAIVQSASMFNLIFYTLSNDWPNHAASHLVSSGSAPSAGGVNANLDEYMEQGFAVGEKISDDAGWWKGVMIWIYSGLVTLVVFLLVAAAMLLATLSKLAVAVLLSVGPIFVIGLMFNATRPYFESWFKALMTFALIPLILYALLALLLSINETYMTAAFTRDLGDRNAFLELIAPIIVITAIGIALLTQVQGIAAQLAGGMALGTQAGLAWAGRNFQRSASRAMQRGFARGGALAVAGAAAGGRAAGNAARAPINFARGYASQTQPKLTGPGYTPTPMDNFRAGVSRVARNVRGAINSARSRAASARSGVANIREQGVAYSAGAATHRTARAVRAANYRRMQGG